MVALTRERALEALVFDVDGTLADTECEGHRVAFNRAFEEFGLNWHWNVSRYGELLAVAGGRERIVDFAQKFLPPHRSPGDVAALAQALYECKTRHYVRLLGQRQVALRPGVSRLIDEARRDRLRLAIATTTAPVNVETLLAGALGTGAVGWFEVIGAGDAVSRKKPAPDIYRYVLERMNLDARRCVAIEDSANGLRASLGAGIVTVVTVNAYTRSERFPGASLVVDRLGEPGRPPAVLAGSMGVAGCVDVSVLRALHARAARQAG